MHRVVRTITSLAAIAVIAATAAACTPADAGTPSASEPAATITSGGVAVVGALGEMPGFDPVRVANVGTGIERAAAVMDTLLYRDERTDEVIGKLAAGIDSEDGRVWVLTLREGVEFTDGEPLDAEAVVFNLERHIAPDSKSAAKSMLSMIESVTATDPLKVTITLSAPSGSFPLALTGSSAASLIGSPKALADPEAFNAHPVGAGPFVFSSWDRDDKLVLTKNEDYWEEGKPYLDGVTYAVMTDPQTRLDSLIAGDLHVGLITSPQWNTAAQQPSLRMTPVPTGGQAITFNATRAPGDDERVRRAASMVFDGKVTADLIFGGTSVWDGDTSCVPWAPGSDACNPEATHEPDMAEAKKLVAEYLAEGGTPDVDLVFFQTQADQGQYIQERLGELGLNVTLRPGDTAMISESQSTGDYGIYLGGTASAGFPTVWNRYYSGATNWGKVAYPELDAALLRARDELELEDRNAAWREVFQILHDDSVSFWYMRHGGAMVSSDRLHLGTVDREYDGSMLVYFDSAWLQE